MSLPDLSGFGILAELIPPFNFGVLAFGTFSPLAVGSIIVTFLLSLLLLNFLSDRFWRTLSQGITPTSGPVRQQLKVKAKWSVPGYGPFIGLSVLGVASALVAYRRLRDEPLGS